MNKSIERISRLAAFAALPVIAAWIIGGCSAAPIWVRPREPFIIYRLSFADPRLSVVRVRADVFGLESKRLRLRAPGSGLERSLEPIDLRASDRRGASLAVRRRDDAWIVESGRSDFIFEYDVLLAIEDRYSRDIRSTMTLLGEGRCRILGRDVFLLPEAPFASGVLVDVDLFPGQVLASSAPSVRNRIIVPDLQELSVTMAAAGDYRRIERRIGGTELALAIGEAWSFGDEEFFDVICRIVAEEIAMLGPAPRSRYLFVCDENPLRGGRGFDYYGIHYGGNMLLLLDTSMDRSALMDAPMAVVAHEFFHNWNGECLGPAGDGVLWFTEGTAVYFSYRVLHRANVITAGQLAARRAATIARYRDNPYARRIAVAEACNSDMSDKDMVNLLYDGGCLAAEALDERIRAETGGAIGLIDVIRRLSSGPGRTDLVGEAALVAAAKELTGVDLSDFIGELMHTPDPGPISSLASSLEPRDLR